MHMCVREGHSHEHMQAICMRRSDMMQNDTFILKCCEPKSGIRFILSCVLVWIAYISHILAFEVASLLSPGTFLLHSTSLSDCYSFFSRAFLNTILPWSLGTSTLSCSVLLIAIGFQDAWGGELVRQDCF